MFRKGGSWWSASWSASSFSSWLSSWWRSWLQVVGLNKFALNTMYYWTLWKYLVHIHSGGDVDPDPKPLQPAIFKTPPKGDLVENIFSLSNFLSNYTHTCCTQANIWAWIETLWASRESCKSWSSWMQKSIFHIWLLMPSYLLKKRISKRIPLRNFVLVPLKHKDFKHRKELTRGMKATLRENLESAVTEFLDHERATQASRSSFAFLALIGINY